MFNLSRVGLSALIVSAGFLGAGWLGAGQTAQAATLVVDRGLPATLTEENIVRWVPSEAFEGDPSTARFIGDEFTVEAGGQDIRLDSLSVFVAPGLLGVNPESLADWFESVFLRVDQGSQDGNLSAGETASAGIFDAVTNSIDNSNILFSKTGQQFKALNQTFADIWRVDFNNLNLTLPSTKPIRFGVKGVGRQIGNTDFSFPFFLMASNSELSGYSDAQNASTDDTYLEFFNDGTFQQQVDSASAGWDKSSDILVQARLLAIDGTQPVTDIPEPSLLVGMTGLLAIVALRKRHVSIGA